VYFFINVVLSFLCSFTGLFVQEGSGGLSVTLGLAAATGLGLLAFTEVRFLFLFSFLFFYLFDLPFGVTQFQ